MVDLQNKDVYSAAVIEKWLREQANLSPDSRAWRKALGGGGSVIVGDDTYLFKSLTEGRYEVYRANATEVQEIFRILDKATKERDRVAVRVLAMAFLIAPLQLAIGLILLVSGAIGLATYKPLPDSSPFAYVLPYQEIFAATLIVGVVILLLTIRKARGEIRRAAALDVTQ